MKVIIHAPSVPALARARAAARDLLAARIQGIVRVLASHDAACAAVADPAPDVDPLTVLCEGSLTRAGRTLPGGCEATPHAALLLVKLARKGWTCIRA